MSTIIILVIAVLFVVVVASVMVGRTTYEVESVRDTEYIELEGHWIRYNVIGGGPPIILVHGWLLSSRIWEQLARRLAQRFTVYTLDLTGFGESDKPTHGYGIRYGSRLLYSFCAHFGIARASVIAHDIGGDMAVKLAADHPDIVGRLVLVATPADDSQIDLPTTLWLTTLPVVGPLFFMLGRLLRPVRKLWMKPFVLDPNDLPEDAIEDPAQATPASAGKALAVARDEISGSRLLRQAGIIKVPVLLVAGEQDRIVDPQSVTDWGQSIGHAEIALLNDCGHLPMVEKTGELGARILAFLTGDERYMNYAREAPAVVPEPPVVQEPDKPQEKGHLSEEPVESAEPAEPAEEPTGEPARNEPASPALGDLNWEFDVGDKTRPRKVIRPKLHESMYQDTGAAASGKTADTEHAHPGDDADSTGVPRSRADESPEKFPGNGSTAREVRKEETYERTRDPEHPEPEGPLSPEGTPDKRDRPKTRRESSGAGRIPEFPGDLFQWSDKPREPRNRRRRGSEKPEDPSDRPDGAL